MESKAGPPNRGEKRPAVHSAVSFLRVRCQDILDLELTELTGSRHLGPQARTPSKDT